MGPTGAKEESNKPDGRLNRLEYSNSGAFQKVAGATFF
jgi:hypothetical protein